MTMKLEHNTEMSVTIKSSRQSCRLYALKWPFLFLPSPSSLLPAVTKGPRAFMIQVHYHASLHCVFPMTTRDIGCFLTALTCDLQWAYSWLQPPLCFLSLVSYGTDSAAPTTARLPLRVPANPYKGRNAGAVRGRVCLAALWLHLQSLN